VSPRPDEATITSSNKIGEHRHDTGSLNVVYTRSRRQFRRFRSNFQSLLQPEIRDGRPISWIDIGAGFGEAIEALQQTLPAGSDVVGIEPMEPKVADAVRRGLPIRVATLDDISQQYDGATLINVFSHVPSPDSFMREVTRVIKPNGLLLLETGNAGDLNSADEYPDELLLPDHLVFAGIDNMRELLTRNGFVVERILEQRLDTASWAARKAIKKLIGRHATLAVPYRSKFRSVFYRARLVNGTRAS
jgi:2-polyprenyl-3-methyl-5-hydroxy-6-metoxy-1,4-benzoquinol methylase